MSERIKSAETMIALGQKALVEAVGSTFTKGLKVTIKGPKGNKETTVEGVDGESVLVATANGTMKRHYSTVTIV